MKTSRRFHSSVSVILLTAGVMSTTAQAAWEPDPAFRLGRAGEFAVLSIGKPTADTLGQSKLDLSAVTIYGDAGVGPFGTLDFQGPSTIHGDLYIDPTLLPQDILSNVGTVTGSRVMDVDLSGAVADALAAADYNAQLPATQILPRLLEPATVYGNGGMNVISVDGIDYARSNPTYPLVLTLTGGEDDLFVLNVKGKFVLGPAAAVRGHDPGRVLINVLPGQTPVQFASDSYVGGTLLSTTRKMGPLQGASGPVIGAQLSEISLLGGAVLNSPPRVPVAVITAPTTALVGAVVTLDGSASTAPLGSTLDYQWAMTLLPEGSTTRISDPADPSTYFIPDTAGDYAVELVVSDGETASEPDRATVTVNEPGEQADLVLDISDDPDPVIRKQRLTYTLSVANQGLAVAPGTVLTAVYSGDIQGSPVVEPADECGLTGVTEITCQLGDLAGMESAEVQVSLLPKAAGTFSLSAAAGAATTDANPEDNAATETTTVLKR